MNREIHVRFWESAGVGFPCATQHFCLTRFAPCVLKPKQAAKHKNPLAFSRRLAKTRVWAKKT
jgi:hypothetical protein